MDYPDLTEDFKFYDNSGLAYTVPFTPNIVRLPCSSRSAFL